MTDLWQPLLHKNQLCNWQRPPSAHQMCKHGTMASRCSHDRISYWRNSNVKGVVSDTTAHAQKCDTRAHTQEPSQQHFFQVKKCKNELCFYPVCMPNNPVAVPCTWPDLQSTWPAFRLIQQQCLTLRPTQTKTSNVKNGLRITSPCSQWLVCNDPPPPPSPPCHFSFKVFLLCNKEYNRTTPQGSPVSHVHI